MGLTDSLVEEALRREVQRLDKRVQVVGVHQDKKRDAYRITLLKDGRTSVADLKTELLRESLSKEGKTNKLRSALGKAVSHLSISYRK